MNPQPELKDYTDFQSFLKYNFPKFHAERQARVESLTKLFVEQYRKTKTQPAIMIRNNYAAILAIGSMLGINHLPAIQDPVEQKPEPKENPEIVALLKARAQERREKRERTRAYHQARTKVEQEYWRNGL